MKWLNGVLGLIIGIFTALPIEAQNNVVYEDKKVLFYQSEHLDFFHWQHDVNDKNQIKYLAHVVEQAEYSNTCLSRYLGHTLSKRANVVFYKTHRDFAATYLLGGHFISEGVLAFAMPTGPLLKEYLLAIKLDRSFEEYDTTITHEMAHIFQYDMGPSIWTSWLNGRNRPPWWIMEGGAEFLAQECNSSRTDDIREDIRRGAGANPEKDLPTWFDLDQERADPYTFGTMTLRFIKERYSEKVVKKFIAQAFWGGEDLIEILAELTNGAIRSPEQFDEAQRDFWKERFGTEMLNKPKPYQENEYFRGRYVVPRLYPYPTISPTVSPDGQKMAVITVSSRYGVVLAVAPTLSREIQEYQPKLKTESGGLEEEDSKAEEWKINVLTPFFPPKHFDYIAMDLAVSNLSWGRVGDKEYIVFFAQKGRDHALFLVDSQNRKEIRSIPIPLDNAFSPQLSPDGTKVYFVAKKNITSDIYSLDLKSKKVINLTNDESYNENPAVSPDGSKIAYVSFWGAYRKLFILHLATGHKEQLTFNAFNDQSPQFSDDGRTIVYTSDEKNGVSNIYTIDLETKLVSQLTDFFGASLTPHFARGESDRIYFVHIWQYDQFINSIHQNFRLFEVLTQKPYRQYFMQDNSESNSTVFIPEKDLFKFELDENQLLNPTPAPEKWSCGGGNITFGTSTYWGMFGQSSLGCSNLLQTKHHLGQFAFSGSLRILNYVYVNQEKRTTWMWGASHIQMPIRYQFYDMVGRNSSLVFINGTWVNETSFGLFTSYPLNRYNRWEFYSKLRRRSFFIDPFGKQTLDLFPEYFTNPDKQLPGFFENSTGSNWALGVAYDRTTVLESSDTWGPLHGNAFRAQLEYAPPLGKEFQSYLSSDFSSRVYRYLGAGSLFAGRVECMFTSRANGDFILMGGPERLRGVDYGSLIGNQACYASGELRFPIPGTYLFGMPVKGFLFQDAAYAKFSDSSRLSETEKKFPPQKVAPRGIGLQFILPIIGWPAQNIWRLENGKLNPSFYITLWAGGR